MPSERVQRRIDDLLDQTEEAVKATEWSRVRELAEAVLVADPQNEDAKTFLAMAERATEVGTGPAEASAPGSTPAALSSAEPPPSTPSASNSQASTAKEKREHQRENRQRPGTMPMTRIEYARTHPRMTLAEIAVEFGISRHALERYFQRHGYKHPDHRTKRFKRTAEGLL
jgi:hypothetical protein